jgi:hypothetical protein
LCACDIGMVGVRDDGFDWPCLRGTTEWIRLFHGIVIDSSLSIYFIIIIIIIIFHNNSIYFIQLYQARAFHPRVGLARKSSWRTRLQASSSNLACLRLKLVSPCGVILSVLRGRPR